MLTIPEVAERYQVSRDTVVSWIQDGLLEALNVAPAKSKRKFYRITPEAVQAFEQNRSTNRAKRQTQTAKPVATRQFV